MLWYFTDVLTIQLCYCCGVQSIGSTIDKIMHKTHWTERIYPNLQVSFIE